MKNNSRILMLVLVSALFLIVGTVAQPGQAQTQTPTAQEGSAMRTISVLGAGQASTQPDVAVLRVGVRTDADTAQEAFSQNNQQMQALLDALADAGIEQENIQTSFVQLQPVYNQPAGEGISLPELAGYMAVNMVTIRLEDTGRVGEILDAAVNAGGNAIEGISFEISDPSALYAQAMEAALTDARRKAEQLASLAGVRLGDIISISEGTGIPIPFAAGGASRLDSSLPVEPGLQNIYVQIQVTWELEPSGSAVIPSTGATQTPTRPAPTATPLPTREPASPTSTVTATPTREPAASTEPLNFRRFVRALEALGEEVELEGQVRQQFFPVIGQLIRLAGGEVQVFEFNDQEAREAVSDTLDETGSILGALAGQPNIWAQGRLIVLYIGQDQDVIDILSQVLGNPITEARTPQGVPPLAALDAQNRLANQLGLSTDEVQIVSSEQVEWPDTCLGFARQGEACAEVLTPGWRIILRASGRQYEAHTDLLAEAIRWRE